MFARVNLLRVRLNLSDVTTLTTSVEVYYSEVSGQFLPLTSKFCPHGCKETHSDR